MSKSAGAALVALVAGLCAALAVESVYRISFRSRPPQWAAATAAGGGSAGCGLPLRLVDSGGIGIPATGSWDDYSHDRRTFREVILRDPPYVDRAALERVDRQWRSYVDRMREYGNNAIAIPLFLELIDFDRLDRRQASGPVYESGSPFLARHAAVRRDFGPLLDWTSQRGLQVLLDTDMLALTAPLSQHLRRLAPGRGAARIDASDPAVWDVYRAGFEELFAKLPAVAGIVVRFGEGGTLYSSSGWPYWSEVDIRDAASLRAMLRGLLPVFEAHHKTLVLRSWTVGVGSLGRLHVDPAVYDAVLGDIDSPALVVSTKYTAGDFFSYLPPNPTLRAGRHRRIVELQAKPEFEGFGAFPDFLGDDHARALRLLCAENPRLAGTYLLPQFGGPLRAGPRTLYALQGFWLWTDANVYVASRLAVDPAADVHQLLRRWAGANFPDAGVADAITRVLVDTREAVLKGFYIRPFAERDVRVARLELPPLMWIFEWNQVGGWHSLLSLVYEGSRDAVPLAIEEGHAAAAAVRRAQHELQAAVDLAGPGGCPSICGDALRSLEYQATLFDALAAWRQAFLSYYRWIETGDVQAWRAWLAGSDQFERAATAHRSAFGHDETFPAFDLTSAERAIGLARHTTGMRAMSAGLLIAAIAVLALGRGPGRRWSAPAKSAAAALTILVSIGGLAGVLTGFASAWIWAGASLVMGCVAAVFESTSADRDKRGSLAVAALAPLLPVLLVLLAIVAYRGPLGFWYWFWMSRVFRATVLALMFATVPWTAYVMFSARASVTWPARVGGLLAAAGAGLVAVFVLLPDWIGVLRLLNRPLNVAPATDTMLFALRTYAGVEVHSGRLFGVSGLLLLVCGFVMCQRRRHSERT